MNKLNPMLLDSDVIVFATPIYYWNFPAQLKTVIDRFQVTVFSMRGKKAVLLATAASKESWVKGALDMEFNNMLRFIGWEDAGRIYALGCSVRGEIENTNYPEQAYELGKSLE
ncbi:MULTISPECIES: flavodoxin family protein [Negativicutes]|nr:MULTISPECIES: NAD(P)H-dependent oxidoreductase [Negativicutes]